MTRRSLLASLLAAPVVSLVPDIRRPYVWGPAVSVARLRAALAEVGAAAGALCREIECAGDCLDIIFRETPPGVAVHFDAERPWRLLVSRADA